MPTSRVARLDFQEDEQDEDDVDIPSDDEDEDERTTDHSTHQRTHTQSSFLQRTENYKDFLAGKGDISDRIRQIFDLMDALKIDLPIFLEAISWNHDIPELISDAKVQYERTALMVSKELPIILARWRRPARRHARGTRVKAGYDTITKFAIDCVEKVIDKEMKQVVKNMRAPQAEISEDSLLAFSWQDSIAEVQELAPTIWTLLRGAAYTKLQDKRNKYKDPNAAVMTMICMAAFTRSHHSCKLQKLLTIYFKSCGLSNKAFDTLHALGVSMSQKWAYSGIDALSEMARAALREDISLYPWLAMHDNLNLPFDTYEQRLDKRDHTDSGTAGTVVVIKDPEAVMLNSAALQAQLAIGAKDPITAKDILLLDLEAAPRIHARAIHQVLKFLIDTPAFDYATYEHKGHEVFEPPVPVRQLPTGPAYAACQYMLDTVHIEESSYEGNDRVLTEFQRQLGLDTPEERMKTGAERVIPWCGDQLTMSRLRGLRRYRLEDLNGHERLDWLVRIFGWLHAEMAFETSLHTQYYGSRAGFGLLQAFELLKRKGLNAPSVKGNFHYGIREALLHIAEAHFRDLWCELGNVEKLEDLRSRSPDELFNLAKLIVTDYASTPGLLDMRDRPCEEQDDVLAQVIQWNRDILDYIDLDEAISSGDVGRIQDLLPRLLFRFSGGRNSKYAIEILELLQGLHREWPDDLRRFVMDYCWLVNTTGREGLFQGMDQLQEHNVRDCKVTFGVHGPFATWEYMQKISASIPCQRKLKDHIEAEINHFRRGKSHTTPEKEADVATLQASYRASQVHTYKPGRTLPSHEHLKDYVGRGGDLLRLQGTIARWLAKRPSEFVTGEDWDSDDTASVDSDDE